MKRIIPLLLCLFLCACNSAAPSQNGEKFILPFEETSSGEINTAECSVLFSDSEAEINGEGASFEGGALTVKKGGRYTLSGDLTGSITIDITKEEKAVITLSDLNVKSETAAINVVSADKVTFVLKGENTLSDGKNYADGDGAEPSACIFSADDMEITGDGTLTVDANCKNGIESKNDITISGGNISITSARNAVKGKDSVEITGGNISIPACYDGIKSDNEKEDGRGIIIISGGNIQMNCSDDGLQAYRSVTVNNTKLQISAKDDKINCNGEISVGENCIN